MTPHPLLSLFPLAIFITSSACGPVCDQPLSSMESIETFEASCEIPSPLRDTWSCGEPFPHLPTLARLEQIHRRCGLEALGSARAFSRAGGQPLRAALIYHWLNSKGLEGAAHVAKHYLESPEVPLNFQLPRIENVRTKPVGTPRIISDDLVPDGSWGPHGYWHLSLDDPRRTAAVGATLHLQTLRHLVASLASDTEPVEIVVESDNLTSLALYPPTSEHAIPVDLDQETLPAIPSSAVVRLTGSSQLTVSDAARTIAHYAPRRVELSLTPAPCLVHDASMRCIEGTDTLPTFYIDRTPAIDDGSCKRHGVCRGHPGQFRHAATLCAYLGKRLPTLFEARAAVLPLKEATWTQTVDAPGEPPLGACGGLYPCAKRHARKLSDGTSLHVNKRIESPLYCASDFPVGTTYPPFMVRSPLPEVEAPSPAPELAALALSHIEHDNLEDKGICGEDIRKDWKTHQQRGGRATTACRDPYSYVTTNEQRRFVWAPYIRNLGGGYAGVGAAQNYDMIAEARSQWAWIFDYDPNVYRLHQILKPLVIASPTPRSFADLFGPIIENQKRATHLIVKHHGPDASASLVSFYYGYRKRLWRHYSKSFSFHARRKAFDWLANDERYAYIRELHQQDRIIPVKGDMLAARGLRSIGKAAKALDVPIRIYYTSNAPTAWGGQITEDYKDNVLGFPFDPQSVLLATYSAKQYGQRGYWLYTVGHALTMQRRIAQAESNRFLVWDRIPSPDPDLALCQVPSQLPGL